MPWVLAQSTLYANKHLTLIAEECNFLSDMNWASCWQKSQILPQPIFNISGVFKEQDFMMQMFLFYLQIRPNQVKGNAAQYIPRNLLCLANE